MKTLNLLTFILILLLAPACKRNGIKAALDKAGRNRGQLQQVLDHYSGPADSLQRSAAAFLIAGMPIHHFRYGQEIDRYAKVFRIIDTLTFRYGALSNEQKMSIGDSLARVYGYADPLMGQLCEDSRVISAEYLINNIDFAFSAWRQAPWKDKVSFNDFCAYILPYRIRDERLEYWRPRFYEEYTKMAQSAPHNTDLRSVFNYMNWSLNTETNFTTFFYRYYPFTQSISDIEQGRIGGCETTSLYAVACMRAAGLPVSLDFLPHWGNAPNRHFLVHLVDRDDSARLSNVNIAVNTWNIVDFSTDMLDSGHRFTPEEFPPGMYIQYTRTIPKVYRFVYEGDKELTTINEDVPDSLIAPEFRRTDIRDVSDEYLRCDSATLDIPEALEKYRLAWLCVFDISGWSPVACSRIAGHQACFGKLGRNVIYLPAVYDHGQFIPTGHPFYADSVKQVHFLAASPQARQTMRLVRKTPLFSYTAYHSQTLKGGRFEGSDSPDFKNASLLYQIEGYPFYMNEVTIPKGRPFRYLRYKAPASGWEADNIAEVRFYDDSGKDTSALSGRYIGSPGTPGHEIGKAFDGDMNSYYENAASRNGWIGLDLGPGVRQRITRIRFCPRNDTNCIIPGDDYELFYWDDRWISLGKQKATGYSLTYVNAPAGGLFWLRCNSGGHEERIFTYEAGKQTWW